MFHDRRVYACQGRPRLGRSPLSCSEYTPCPLAQHGCGGHGRKLGPEFGPGRVPALARPLGTLAVHEPPGARLRDTTVSKHVCDVPHEPGVIREAAARWPRSLGLRQFPQPAWWFGVKGRAKLHPRPLLVVLRAETPKARTHNADKEPWRVSTTDDPGMVGGGEEIQPLGFALRDVSRGDGLSVEVQEPRGVSEIFGFHVQ